MICPLSNCACSRRRDIGIPSLDSRRREEVTGCSCSAPIIDRRLTSHDFIPEGRHFATDNRDSRVGVDYQSSLIVTKNEFSDKSERLNTGVSKGKLWPEGTHGDRVRVTEKMSGVSNKDVGPTTFLMDDTSQLACIIVPRRFWSARETLDSTKRRILSSKQLDMKRNNICHFILGWRLHAE